MNALLLGVAVTIGAPALKDRPKDEQAILGDWQLVEWLQGNQVREIGEGAGVEFRSDGQRLVREGPGKPDARAYQLHAKTNPAQIDLIRTDGGPVPAVYPCIFKVEAEKLVIAIGNAGGDLPTSFSASDCYMLMTYTRLKK